MEKTSKKVFLGLAVIGLIGIGWFFTVLPSVTAERGPFILYGSTSPVRVPAHTRPVDAQRGVPTAVISTTTVTVPEDGWVTAFFSPILHGAPDASLRFSWLFDPSQDDPYWSGTPRVVFVMSVERVPDIRFSNGYGYFVKKGTQLQVMGGFANFSDADYEAVSIDAQIEFVPASSGASLQEAYPVFLNAEKASIFLVPPQVKRFTKRLPQPFTVPFDGSIVLLGSHGHKFLDEILLTLNGKELWRTSPIHLPDGTNLGNPIYSTPYNGVPVKTGDTLDLIEWYSNPTKTTTDAMSSMYVVLLPKTATSSHGH